nr:hypothetical protein [Tanacetum cinerariifolium]
SASDSSVNESKKDNNQANDSPHLDNEDLEQIDTDDLKEMDLKWQVVAYHEGEEIHKENRKESEFQWQRNYWL